MVSTWQLGTLQRFGPLLSVASTDVRFCRSCWTQFSSPLRTAFCSSVRPRWQMFLQIESNFTMPVCQGTKWNNFRLYMTWPGWRFQRSRKILSIPKDFHWKTLFCLALHIVLLARALLFLCDACAGDDVIKRVLHNKVNDCFLKYYLRFNAFNVCGCGLFFPCLSRSAFALPNGQLLTLAGLSAGNLLLLCPAATPIKYKPPEISRLVAPKWKLHIWLWTGG